MTAPRGRALVAILVLLAGADAGARTLAQAEAAGAPAAKQLPRRVVLDASACPDVPAPALRRIMAIEIGDLLVGARENVVDDVDRVELTCLGGEALVHADGPRRPRALARTLPLADFPGDAAPRALALAAIEILAALSPDVRERIEARQRPRAPPPPPPPPVIERVPEPRPPHASVVLGAGAYRTFLPSAGATTWGGRVGFRRALGARLELGADADLGRSTTSDSLGDVTTTLASASAFVGVRAGGPRLDGGVAVGGRVGLARLEGRAADPLGFVGERASHPWGGPLLVARGRGSAGPVGLELSAELGWAFGRAAGTAGDATVVAVGGTWLAVTVGLGLGF